MDLDSPPVLLLLAATTVGPPLPVDGASRGIPELPVLGANTAMAAADAVDDKGKGEE